MAIIGIDLGTTNSLVAVFQNGESILIPNEYNELFTPSVVSINEKNEIIVGKAAKERLISFPDKTVSIFKRTMGTDKSYKLGNKRFLSEELSAFVLQSLKADAEKFLNESVEEAIISVPAYFDDARRQATKRAGELAGLRVERIINEPSAAALACRMYKRKEIVANTVLSLFQNKQSQEEDIPDDQIYMIFDFGGGTLDISLVECFENVIGITAVSGNNHLGGSDIDHQIVKAFCIENNIIFDQLDVHLQGILYKQAEKVKILLSSEENVNMNVHFDDFDWNMHLNQEKLIQICEDILKETLKPISKVLMDSQTNMREIDEIVLIGGSSKMPMISKFLEVKTGKKPAVFGSPDIMVAIGLGIYAGMKERNEQLKDIVMTDICPFTLGVDVHNENNKRKPLMSPIIERNTILPCTKKEIYYPMFVGQDSISFNVYQGESIYVEDNIFLGSMEVKLPPNDLKREAVEFRMTYDINGILDIEATVLSTGEIFHDCIVSNYDLSDEEIQKKKMEIEIIKKEKKENAKEIFLKEQAERLFYMTSGELRSQIAFYLTNYNRICLHETPLKIKRYTEFFENYLNQIDTILDHYGIFDEKLEFGEDTDGLLDDTTD